MRPFAALVLLLLLTGCPVVAPVGGPVPEGMGGAVPGEVMPFPECQTGEYAFVGESTLEALGLAELGPAEEASQVGMIWVTAGPVAIDVAQPVPAGGGKVPVAVPAGRTVCVQWPDGSGMSASVPDDWVLPADVADAASVGTPAESTGSVPLGTLALVVGAVVLIAVSVVAFRRETA
jgi:hypothetical protein